jgi:hypothetical protein
MKLNRVHTAASLKRTRFIREKWRTFQPLRHPQPEKEKSEGFKKTPKISVNGGNLGSMTLTAMTMKNT